MRKNTQKLLDDFEVAGYEILEYNHSKKPALLRCKKHNINFIVTRLRRSYIDETCCPLCKAEIKMNKYKI